jgi:UDP-N-acetylmuramyl pentapeptide phosphotransferase/UDP-N-acetylglucosamine-1-phosphate transferase
LSVVPALLVWWLLPAAAFASGALTLAMIAYARRRGLLDQPGQRRSHRVPTPRGGGVAIVAVSLAAMIWLGCEGWLPPTQAWASLAALLAVAAIGFWDDHRALRALPRLIVHLGAALLVAWVWLEPADAAAWAVVPVATLALAGLLNFWNFMDGINGIASVQAAWLGTLLGAVMLAGGQPGAGLVAGVLAAACLGFLPFNLPTARIFLGDVGSGFLGLAVGCLLLMAWKSGNLGLPALVLLPSAFLIDAGATLLLRMLAGRRWYTAHRSHLYQWLARRGRSHTRIVLMSLTWNLPTSALALYLGPREDPAAFAAAGAVLAGGLGLWWGCRRRLLREAAGAI